MPYKGGQIIKGHPYVEVLVSADGRESSKFTALIDTGFSGFMSVPTIPATLLGLRSHTTARYGLANGKLSDPIPLAYGYACLEGDPFVRGLISISGNTSFVVGMDFLTRCGKVLMVYSKGVIIISETDLRAEIKAMGASGGQ